MSKNVRKNSSVEKQIKAEDAERAALELRNHEFAGDTRDEDDAPAGRGESVAAQVSGPTLFDALEDCSSVGQVTAWRAISNGAKCGVVFAVNERLSWDGPTHDNGELGVRGLLALARYERMPARIGHLIDLANYADLMLEPLVAGGFPGDRSMSLDEVIEFACNNAGMNQEPQDQLPVEVLEALGISREEIAAIDAEEATKRAVEGQKLRASCRENAEAIRAELVGQLDIALGTDDVTTSMNAQQHRALFQKILKKMGARLKQLIASRSRYTGAVQDAMFVASDSKQLDKAYVQFCRANVGELNELADA